jgi:hypothetical protein
MQQAIKKVHDGTIRLSVSHFGPVRSLLMGAGFAYAVEKDAAWWHYPIIFVVPSVYAGYHTYKRREAVAATAKRFYTSSTTISSEGVFSVAAAAAPAAELK